MSNNNVRLGFLKQKCVKSTLEGWQRRCRNNVFGQLVPRGPETSKTRLFTNCRSCKSRHHTEATERRARRPGRSTTRTKGWLI